MNTSSKTANAEPFPVLKVLILVTGIALAALSWYAFSHWLRSDGDITWYPPSAECDLHTEPCSVTLADKGSLTFSVNVDGRIESLEILPLNVSTQGMEVSAVDVDFVGRTMDMGINRFSLAETQDGQFHGQGQLGVCTLSVMPWRARVILETPDGRMGSWFDFDVIRS